MNRIIDNIKHCVKQECCYECDLREENCEIEDLSEFVINKLVKEIEELERGVNNK